MWAMGTKSAVYGWWKVADTELKQQCVLFSFSHWDFHKLLFQKDIHVQQMFYVIKYIYNIYM